MGAALPTDHLTAPLARKQYRVTGLPNLSRLLTKGVNACFDTYASGEAQDNRPSGHYNGVSKWLIPKSKTGATA